MLSYFSPHFFSFFFFFFNDTATTEIYTLSLHDALPISPSTRYLFAIRLPGENSWTFTRSEEHTSELQSPCNLVCRLLLEKKKKVHDDGGKTRRTMQRGLEAAAVTEDTGHTRHFFPVIAYRSGLLNLFFFFLKIRGPPRSTLFPYTTLFRSTFSFGLPPSIASTQTSDAGSSGRHRYARGPVRTPCTGIRSASGRSASW